MGNVAVLGVGLHRFGKFEESASEISRKAVEMALEDAGMEWREVQAVVAGSPRLSAGGFGFGLNGNEMESIFGMTGIPVFNVAAACATGGNAFSLAHMMIECGQCDTVLVCGGEKMPRGFIPRPTGAANDASDVDYLRWACVGIPNPAYWALECNRRMHDHGTTEEHLAKVVVKARGISVHNPNARYRKAITIEEVLASPMISSPLRQFEICAVSDGAAAAILCSPQVARQKMKKPVWSAASVIATGQFGDSKMRIPELSGPSSESAPFCSEATGAVSKALEKAGITPADVDLVELQDNTPWQELTYPEVWGFCEPGKSEWMLDRGETSIGGKLPINPSGGFLSFGEATIAMGLFQVFEMTCQLRGQAGLRQVEGARVALGQTMGMGGNGAAIVLKN
jgi:acetyl-CoA acetyltransferase